MVEFENLHFELCASLPKISQNRPPSPLSAFFRRVPVHRGNATLAASVLRAPISRNTMACAWRTMSKKCAHRVFFQGTPFDNNAGIQRLLISHRRWYFRTRVSVATTDLKSSQGWVVAWDCGKQTLQELKRICMHLVTSYTIAHRAAMTPPSVTQARALAF